jgi:hypothetical protein
VRRLAAAFDRTTRPSLSASALRLTGNVRARLLSRPVSVGATRL